MKPDPVLVMKIAEQLAEEAEVPLLEAQRVYEDEYEELSREARVQAYLPVIAAKHARARLKHH